MTKEERNEKIEVPEDDKYCEGCAELWGVKKLHPWFCCWFERDIYPEVTDKGAIRYRRPLSCVEEDL